MTNTNQTQKAEHHLQVLPNSTTVLVLGILSIFFFCLFFGLFSLTLGIIALVLAQQSNRMYKETPRLYSESSLKNLNAGKTCAIIGVILSGLIITISIFALIFSLSVALSAIPFCV